MRTILVTFLSFLVASTALAQHGPDFVRPDSIVDLRTDEGAKLVNGQWRYSDAGVVEVDHQAPGADLKPTGAPTRTHDIEPKAGAADFDDSGWQVIGATTLEARRTTGRLAFGWYRVNITVPAKL